MANKSKPRPQATEKTSPAESPPEAAPQTPAPARRGRALKVLLVLGLLAGGVAWFAPTIVAHTSLRHEIVPRLFPEIEARATVGRASLGWFSPVTLRDLQLRDEAGEAWLAIDELTSTRTLWELASDSSRLGTFRAVRPALTIAVRPGGSNVEDAITDWLAAPSSGAPTPFVLEVTEGTVEILRADAAAGASGESAVAARTRIEDLQGAIEQSAAASSPLTVKAAGSIPTADRTGRLELEATVSSAEEGAALDYFCNVDNLALESLDVPLLRLGHHLRMSGGLNGETRGRITLADEGPLVAAGGRVELQKPVLAAPQWIGADRLKAVYLSAGGALEFGNGQLALEDVRLDCDLGSFRANGAVGVTDLRRPTAIAGIVPALLERDDFDVEGHVDLAKVVALLPETLHIRRDTEITGGRIDLVLTGREENGSRTLRGKLDAAGLTAVSGGKTIRWDQPLHAEVHAVARASGPFLEKLECRSDFLEVTARGTLEAATMTARGDLDRLAAELRRFSDLGDLRLAGTMTAGLETKRGENDALSVTGNATVDRFELTAPGKRPWREERLTIDLAAAGRLQGSSLEQLDRGTVRLRSGRDELDFELQPSSMPVAESSVGSSPVSIRLVGDLASWSSRLEPFLPLDSWVLDGGVTLTGRGSFSTAQFALETAEVDFERFSATGHGCFIQEPRVHVVTSGQWDVASRRWTSPRLTWASSSLSLRADAIAVELAENGMPKVAGTVLFRGGLQPMANWFHDPRTPAEQTFAGIVGGRVEFAVVDSTTAAEWDVLVKEFAVTAAVPKSTKPGSLPPGNRPAAAATAPRTWSEPELKVAGEARYDHRLDRLEIARAEVRSRALRVDAKGTLAELTTTRHADLAGEVEYDLEKVLVALGSVLGDGVRMTGTGARPFALRGPLVLKATAGTPARPVSLGSDRSGPRLLDNQPAVALSNDLTGNAGLGWTSADFYGFHAGPGELALRLEQGVVHIQPLDLVVSEGRLKATPRVLLNTSPMFLALDKGPLIENVRFSPEMCENWLKYVAPMLADATEIDGKFSVDLSGGMIPLTEPRGGDLAGTLAIHTAQVNPGPLADQFITIANQVKAVVRRQPGAAALRTDRALMVLPKQNVEFWMVDGRVHHRQLELQFGDTVVRTEGSVGLDKSLALVAHVPIRDEWLGSDRLVAGLKGQSIRVPIGGTLDRPQIDNRALADLTRKLTGSAINGAIQNELGKQLEKLFGPRN